MKNTGTHDIFFNALLNRAIDGAYSECAGCVFTKELDKVWLTVNRTCNFRCPYCYAETTNYKDEMPLDLAKDVISFAKSMGAKAAILIGGEPLLYSKLDEIVSFINDKGMRVVVVTNGLEITNKKIQNLMDNHKIHAIGFSVKGWDEQSYFEQTKVHVFERVKKAMSIFAKSDVNGSYSFVLTKDTHDKLKEVAEFVCKDTKRKLKFILCNPVVWKDGKIDGSHMVPVEELVESFTKQYAEVNDILQGRLVLQQSLPMCVWSSDFIEHLQALQQIQFGCNIRSQKGLAFGIHGEVLLCNAIADFPIAQFGKDFVDRESFVSFINSENSMKYFNKIFKYPLKQCDMCDRRHTCFGGCPFKWFVYSVAECYRLIGSKCE